VLEEAVEILLLQVVLQFKMVVLVEAEVEVVEVPLQQQQVLVIHLR
tara:strand:+ start:96 stop:233 length:138 start_codon:yes stop_codon:yes gene_type:complete